MGLPEWVSVLSAFYLSSRFIVKSSPIEIPPFSAVGAAPGLKVCRCSCRFFSAWVCLSGLNAMGWLWRKPPLRGRIDGFWWFSL
jgi:hypothetical protein